jgi:hypothetical protein
MKKIICTIVSLRQYQLPVFEINLRKIFIKNYGSRIANIEQTITSSSITYTSDASMVGSLALGFTIF